jgi:hypothetical protein
MILHILQIFVYLAAGLATKPVFVEILAHYYVISEYHTITKFHVYFFKEAIQ